MSEYNNFTVGSSGCSYASLGNYNQGHGKGPMAPVAAGVPSMATQVIPQYKAPNYDALTHGQAPSCGGYFGIQGAYSSDCTTFAPRACAGSVEGYSKYRKRPSY